MSQSFCEDSLIQEESGISEKIKSVNIHNNIAVPHQMEVKSVTNLPEVKSQNLKTQLNELIHQIDGLLLQPKI